MIGEQTNRWKIRRIAKGNVFEVGCGIGRNLNFFSFRVVVSPFAFFQFAARPKFVSFRS
jgi:hypothetical protein